MLPNSFWNIPLVNLSHFRAGFPTGFYKFAIIWVSIIDCNFSNEIQLFHALTHSSSFKKTNRKSSPYIFVDWSAIIVYLKYWNLKARWRHNLDCWKNCKVMKNDYSCQTSCQSMNNVHNAPLAKTLKSL